MPALYMEFGQDLQTTAQGGLRLAYDGDEVRQGIQRDLLTTPALTLGDGTTTAAEYLWDTLGQGLRVLIGQNVTPAMLSTIKQKATNSALKNPGVNPSIPPTFTVTENDASHSVTIQMNYTLSSGAPGSLALQVGGGNGSS